jgi:tetratricopeptide (TPR) repeat protein
MSDLRKILAEALNRSTLGRPDEALVELQQLATAAPGDKEIQLGLASALNRLGRFTEALRVLDSLLAEEPDSVEALLAKVDAARHLQRPREWLESSRRVWQLAPDTPRAHFQMHLVCLAEANVRSATEHLLRAIELHPQYADAHVALGNLRWLAQDLDRAQAELEQAVAMAPGDGRALGLLAHFQVATGRGQPDLEQLTLKARAMPYSGLPYQLGRLYLETVKDLARAERFLALALEQSPELVDARRMLADLYLRQGRNPEALALFRRIVELSPELGVAWNGLALGLAREGRTREALQAYAEAARLLPNEVSVFQGYGAALLQAGDVGHALPLLQRALALQPEAGHTLFLLATALEEAGQHTEALDMARKAYERLPQDENVRWLLERLQG